MVLVFYIYSFPLSNINLIFAVVKRKIAMHSGHKKTTSSLIYLPYYLEVSIVILERERERERERELRIRARKE